MPSVNDTSMSTTRKYTGQSTLNWCPQCGRKLREENIQLKNGDSVYGMRCPYCYYIHNPEFITSTKEMK